MQNLEKCNNKDIEKLKAELETWKQRSKTKQSIINLLKIQNRELNKQYALN